MTITCCKCGIHLGEITGSIRLGLARFICARCLAEMEETAMDRGERMFETLFGGRGGMR